MKKSNLFLHESSAKSVSRKGRNPTPKSSNTACPRITPRDCPLGRFSARTLFDWDAVVVTRTKFRELARGTEGLRFVGQTPIQNS